MTKEQKRGSVTGVYRARRVIRSGIPGGSETILWRVLPSSIRGLGFIPAVAVCSLGPSLTAVAKCRGLNKIVLNIMAQAMSVLFEIGIKSKLVTFADLLIRSRGLRIKKLQRINMT